MAFTAYRYSEPIRIKKKNINLYSEHPVYTLSVNVHYVKFYYATFKIYEKLVHVKFFYGIKNNFHNYMMNMAFKLYDEYGM